MFCRHCGNKIADDSKFCQYCGGKVLDEDVNIESVDENSECGCCCDSKEETQTCECEVSETKAVEEMHESGCYCKVDTDVMEDNHECKCCCEENEACAKEDDLVEVEEIVDKTDETSEESREWYYVEAKDSKGPFSELEMKGFVESDVLNASSLVWKVGMQDWVKLSETELYEEPVKENEEAIWYYVENKDSKGPYTINEMNALIENETIKPMTYVWRSGMDDWKHMKETELFQETSSQTSSKMSASSNSTNLNITSRSIGLSIILSICTCGLYTFYWLYCIAKDINTIAKSQEKETGLDAGLVVLLSIVTCSLFLLYYYWKVGKILNELEYPNGNHPNDDGIVLILLGFFGLDIISYSILQSTINDFTK